MTPLDPTETAALRAMTDSAFDVLPGLGAFFKRDYLARHGFGAVIFEGDFRDQAGAVSHACRGLDVAKCLNIERGTVLPAYRFKPTHEQLEAVRHVYHSPSYAVLNDAMTFMLVSDSDYYWGFAARPGMVAEVARSNASLRQRREDIRPFLDSDDPHDRRIGAMLSDFHDVCETAAETVA